MSTPLPRLDPYLVSIGEELEDLSGVAPAQPFQSHGPTLARDDLDILVRAVGGRGRRSGTTDALVAGKFLTAEGEATPDGRTVATLLAAPTGRLRIESGRGRAPLTLDVSIRSGLALAVSTVSPAALAVEPHGDQLRDAATTIGVDVLDCAGVPALVASWLALGPAWSLATSPVDLPEELVMARVEDASVAPPDDADPHLRHAWEQPWFLWTAQGSGSTSGLVVVNAGISGHLALTTSELPDHVGLRPMLSTHLFGRLVDMAALASLTRN